MDIFLGVLGFLGGVLRQLVVEFIFEFIFFWPGWLVLNLVTLGRYPKLRKPRQFDYFDFYLISSVGVISCGLLAIAAIHIWGHPQ